MYLGILTSFIWPILVVILIIYLLGKRRGEKPASHDKNWFMRLSLCKEDTVSQWFLLLSVFFLGAALLALNRDLGDLLSWTAIIFLSSITGIVISYYFKTISTLIFSLIGISSWWTAQAMHWVENKDVKASALLFGLVLISLIYYVLGFYHEKKLKNKRFGIVYLILGIVSMTLMLFVFSSRSGLETLEKISEGAGYLNSRELTVSLLLLFAGLVCLTLYSTGKRYLLSAETAAVFILMLIFGLIVFLPQQIIFKQSQAEIFGYINYYAASQSNFTNGGVIWAVVFNFLVFFEQLGLIFSGYLRKEEWLINLGTFFLFILVIFKYFDWFFSFLDKSLFFIGAGVMLFAVGWFMEKSRRYMISNITDVNKLPRT